MIGRVKKFAQEVKVELGKVSWTSRQELWGSTLVVVASVILLALFIGLCDFILAQLIRRVIRW
ncbi:MAG: preprotein translocase subunit SecE [Candidatus Omnitrophica bacterium]|nr:preprotein translocase subunit SecE [Candidatus Omnitrophota bacterium]